MPSLKPNRLRGVACVVDVDDVRPKPSWDQRSAAVPKPIRARLRIACTATCGSSAQAWTQRSPSLRPGRGRRRGSAAAAAAPRAAGPRARSGPCRRRREQRRAEAEGQRQPGRRQPERLAGVARRGVVGQRRAVARPAGPAVIAAAAAVQRSQQRRPARRGRSVVTSKAAKCSRSWAGVTMPAWCSPWKGYAPGRRPCAGLGRRWPRAAPTTAGEAAAPRPRTRAGDAEQPPAADGPGGLLGVSSQGDGCRQLATAARTAR